jgi:hypothetical protein
MRSGNGKTGQSRSENVAKEVGTRSANSRKNAIVLWPSLAMLALCLGLWVFLYNDGAAFLLLLACFLFSVACFVYSLVLAVLDRTKRSLSFIPPVLLYVATGFAPPLPGMTEITDPIRIALVDSRDHVEFLVYDVQHHIKVEVRQNGYKYKEWRLQKHSGKSFYIVYDVTDAIAGRDGMEGGGCVDLVLKVEEHFYFLRVVCLGFFQVNIDT